jgi:hypothetical protein
MPNLALVSAKEIMPRVIRALGYKLPSVYHDDILEWIPEAMGYLQVTRSLEKVSTGDINCPDELYVTNHCVKLPCGFVAAEAIEDMNGRRLPEGGDVTDIKAQSSIRHLGVGASGEPRVTAFQVNPYQHQTSDGLPADEPSASFPFLGEDVEPSANGGARTSHYYKIVGNYIQTSFEEGYIRLHYWSVPVCPDGYPMIPDNENYKQAIEWHIIRRLIGSGFQHPVFDYKFADAQFELYASRGMAEVSFWSPDQAAKLQRSFVRLIPPYHFQEDFFVNSEQSERLYK